MQAQAPREFRRKLLDPGMRRTPPTLKDDIPFGRVPTDHMVVCDFIPEKGGWQTPEIVPFGPFEVLPSAVVFHYGQTIFEGMKAYCSEENGEKKIFLFRPEENAKRLYRSALRLGMEPVPIELFLNCVKELVKTDANWILPSPGSLYIRPALIPLDNGVSYRSSLSYRFFVILSPAKNYYKKETAISVYVEREKVRAVRGGVGDAKCGGNYAAALPSLNRAKSLGAEQVLWLDAFEHRYVEEVGAMNIMFVYGNRIVTPPLSGSILPGVTRSSIVSLAPYLGIPISEERITIDSVFADARSGKLTEVFGCGTAAVISPVGELITDNETISVSEGKVGEITLRLKKALLGLQTGVEADPFGWRVQV